MPEPLVIEPKCKNIGVEINTIEFVLHVYGPSIGLMQKLAEENNSKRILSEWIYNSIDDESQKGLIGIDDIYKQDDNFFDKFFLEFLKDNEEILSFYNDRDNSEDACVRFVNAYTEYQKIMTAKLFSKVNIGIGNILNTYTSNFSKVMNAVNSVNETCKAIVERINKMVSSIYDTIGKIKIPQISEERKQKLINSYTQWGKYGWTQHPESPVFYYEYCPKTKLEAEKYASKVCSETNMNILFEYLKKEKLVTKSDLNEAITCYNSGCKKACAMLLLSMIERVLIKLQINDKKENLLVGNGAVKFFEDKFNSGIDIENTFFFFLEYTCLTSCLKEYFKKGKNFVVDTEVANRNQIDHGMYKKRVLKRDCTKLFLLLYNLIYFINIMEEK